MADAFTMKRGDLLPALEIVLTNDDVAIDLTGAAEIRIIGRQKDVVIFNRVVTGDANGLVTMNWQAGDTDDKGRIWIEVQVSWPGGGIQSYPPDSWLAVNIAGDIA